jgi:hypothetical protein
MTFEQMVFWWGILLSAASITNTAHIMMVSRRVTKLRSERDAQRTAPPGWTITKPPRNRHPAPPPGPSPPTTPSTDWPWPVHGPPPWTDYPEGPPAP